MTFESHLFMEYQQWLLPSRELFFFPRPCPHDPSLLWLTHISTLCCAPEELLETGKYMHSTPGQAKPFTFDTWEMGMMSFPYHTGLWNFVVKIMLKPLVDEEMK